MFIIYQTVSGSSKSRSDSVEQDSGKSSQAAPWSTVKNDILSKYTTSERLSITTSFLTSQGAESVRSKLNCSYTLFVLLLFLI